MSYIVSREENTSHDRPWLTNSDNGLQATPFIDCNCKHQKVSTKFIFRRKKNNKSRQTVKEKKIFLNSFQNHGQTWVPVKYPYFANRNTLLEIMPNSEHMDSAYENPCKFFLQDY